MPMTMTFHGERSAWANSAAVSRWGVGRGLQGLQGRGRRTHNVGDAQAGGELQVDFAGVEAGGVDLVIGQQAGVANALPAGCVIVASGVGDGLNCVEAGLSGGRRDAEEERLGVAAVVRWKVDCAGSERQPEGSCNSTVPSARLGCGR